MGTAPLAMVLDAGRMRTKETLEGGLTGADGDGDDWGIFIRGSSLSGFLKEGFYTAGFSTAGFFKGLDISRNIRPKGNYV